MKNILNTLKTYARVKRTYPSLNSVDKTKKNLPENFMMGMTNQHVKLESD